VLSSLRIAIAVAALCACGGVSGDDGAGGTCTPPAQLTYSCEPMPLGTPSTCTGGPAFGGRPQADTDKAFPVGCEAAYPFCVAAYPNSVQTCYCQYPGTDFEWTCPV
jgi:hypothetical protein